MLVQLYRISGRSAANLDVAGKEQAEARNSAALQADD
jgi:hypothetical protein